MSETRALPVHDLRHDIPFASRRGTPSRRARFAWIDEDPDLAPTPRAETPLWSWT